MRFFLLLLLFMLLAGTGFAADLLVFAGSGLRAPLEELGQDFSHETGLTVAFDFDGSGRLGSKILMGIKPDLFVPGSQTWGEKLKTSGYVDECVAIAYHTPIIITPKGEHKVKSFTDLTRQDIKLALGDTKAAAIGRNNQRLFQRSGINPNSLNIVARGINVKQLVSWVETGSVDAAIVWRADAFQSQQVASVEIPEELNMIDSIPLCRMATPQHPEAAARFWEYLQTHGVAVFAKHGFKAIER